MAEGDGDAEGTECHAQWTEDEEGFASPLLDGEDSNEGEEDVDDTHEDGDHHRVVHAHVAEDARSIVEHGIDADLLEDAEHDADEDTHGTIGHEAFGLLNERLLDGLEDELCTLATIDACQYFECVLVLADSDEVTRWLRHEADEQCEESCGDSLGTEHVTPTGGNGPLCCGIDGCDALTHFLYEGLDVVAEDEEVNEINHQLTEDDGKLVAGDEHASDVGGCYLADIHRADGWCETYADATDDAVDVEHDEQRVAGFSVGEEQELGLHGSQCWDEEEESGNDQRALTSQIGCQEAGEGRTDDTAYECAGRGESVPTIGIGKVLWLHEKRLKTLFGSRDDGRIIAEQ